MRISQKCYYALQAVLELAKRGNGQTTAIADIGKAQGIPHQFLQVIMRELRQGGFCESRRGKQGGYLLSKEPRNITMGAVIRFMEGEFNPIEQVPVHREGPDLAPDYVFHEVWDELKRTVNSLFDRISFADLVDRDKEQRASIFANFVI